jgi:hypothetical protein
MTSSLSSDSFTIGSRIDLLSCMVQGAYLLSAVPSSRQDQYIRDKANTTKSIHDQHADMSLQKPEESNIGTTTVKRPIRLSKLKERKKYFRNNFTSCAKIFFHAALSLFQSSIGRLSAQLESISSFESPMALPDPGLAVLLPSQALLALGSFVSCAINTPLQRSCNYFISFCVTLSYRKFINLLFPITLQLRRAPYLHLRRASAKAMFDCVEATIAILGEQRFQSSALRDRQLLTFGTLDYMMNIGGGDDIGGFGHSRSSLTPMTEEAISWSAEQLKEEADDECRFFQLEMIKIGVEFLQSEKTV